MSAQLLLQDFGIILNFNLGTGYEQQLPVMYFAMKNMMRSSLMAVLVGAVLAGALSVFGRPGATNREPVARAGVISVMHAGALGRILERRINPAFSAASGFGVLGEGKGSLAIANLIQDGIKAPDVFLSADPSVNETLRDTGNGAHVSWWVPFARTELVVAWSPTSRLAPAFEDAKGRLRTVESVLKTPGLKLGRTDPELDPKGYRSLFLFQLDEKRTGEAGLKRAILGPDRNASQIFPEEILAARVQSGALDAGIFYTVEAVTAGLPFVSLPAEINQGDQARAREYATASYTTERGRNFSGSPISFTVTIPATVRNLRGAVSFVRFLLGAPGQELLSQEGLLSTPPVAGGDPDRAPASLQPLLAATEPPPAPGPSPNGSPN